MTVKRRGKVTRFLVYGCLGCRIPEGIVVVRQNRADRHLSNRVWEYSSLPLSTCRTVGCAFDKCSTSTYDRKQPRRYGSPADLPTETRDWPADSIRGSTVVGFPNKNTLLAFGKLQSLPITLCEYQDSRGFGPVVQAAERTV